MSDPFDELGLSSDARPDDVRSARRQLAKQHHPDTGGDAQRMRAINAAAAAALRLIAEGDTTTTSTSTPTAPTDARQDSAPDPTHQPTWQAGARDMPSFTVEALPAETFEALLVATSTIGEVVDDDPPYRLEVLIGQPSPCWCRLELVPDAGATTVSLTVGALDALSRPSVEQVRDLWIDQLNRLDW